jgi:hypothetical protein
VGWLRYAYVWWGIGVWVCVPRLVWVGLIVYAVVAMSVVVPLCCLVGSFVCRVCIVNSLD